LVPLELRAIPDASDARRFSTKRQHRSNDSDESIVHPPMSRIATRCSIASRQYSNTAHGRCWLLPLPLFNSPLQDYGNVGNPLFARTSGTTSGEIGFGAPLLIVGDTPIVTRRQPPITWHVMPGQSWGLIALRAKSSRIRLV
jgi:hypothetical protein